MKPFWIAILTPFLIGGCSQLPGPTPTDAGLPLAYPIDTGGAEGLKADDIAWRDFFGDPRLVGLIDQALQNNWDLKIAVLRIDEAAALRRIARADRFPTLELGASGSIRDGQDNSQSRGTMPGQPDGPGQPGQGGSAGEQYRLDVGVSAFELDFWGRVRSLEASALADYLGTVEAQRAFRLSLIAAVAEAYLTERELAERADLARETIVSRERSLYLARRLFEEGEGSDLEVQQELALLADAQTTLADVRSQAAQAENLLRLLIGGDAQNGLPPALPLEAQGLVETLSAGLPSALLLRRPDVREAEQSLRAAEADVGATRAALFPRISLTGDLGFASADLGSLLSSSSGFSSLAADLVQPLFDARRRRSEVEASEARRGIAVAEYERTVQTAFREVADALAIRRFLADQRLAEQASFDAQRRRLELADLRFEAGVTSAVDVLEARRQLFIARQALVTSRRAELTNAVSLYTALGGGPE